MTGLNSSFLELHHGTRRKSSSLISYCEKWHVRNSNPTLAYNIDEHCLKILKNCYDAIPNDGKVIVLEAHIPIVPENIYASKSTSQLDVLMMTQNPGGKERTKKEFIDLATRVGFRGIRCECCVRNFWVMEFFK
ncbi:caffeic acid O-methyltransferase [Medicago truncatula]|uniref:Caffeic acid O-methyltransferase n=1 Tax=Medicago truncatula TaxID=3880 RepID=A0A072TRS7_MEDTR|nr:caffeic acid O-methyltransferase [Medicago truncatula]